MKVNLPPKVRLGIYIFTGIGSFVVAYLKVKGYIGDPEMALWVGASGFVNGLAAINTDISQ